MTGSASRAGISAIGAQSTSIPSSARSYAISRAGWINRPMRRPQTLDAASLLVDQDRCLPSHCIAELANEPAQHIGRRYVAFEKNEPPRVRIADELLFVGGKGRSRQSGNKRAHASQRGRRPRNARALARAWSAARGAR